MTLTSPPPWAFDYSSTAKITHAMEVVSDPTFFPFIADEEEAFPEQTTQTIQDNYPLEYGKHRGKTPLQVEKIDPGWIVWATKNVDKHRIVWSDELADRCEKKYAALPKLRR